MLKTPSKLLILCLFVLLTGCAVSTQISNTQRSSVEQRLLVRSFERALATLDTQEFKGKTVAVDFYGLTPDKDFMPGFGIATFSLCRLSSRRVAAFVDGLVVVF